MFVFIWTMGDLIQLSPWDYLRYPFFSDKPIQAGDLFKIIQVQDDASTVELAHLSEFRYGCGQLYFNHQASYIYSWFMLVLYTRKPKRSEPFATAGNWDYFLKPLSLPFRLGVNLVKPCLGPLHLFGCR